MSSESTPRSTASTTTGSSNDQRTLVIALTAVFSVLGVVLIGATAFFCVRYRQNRIPFFERGITPINDDEIESWKISPEARFEKEVPPAANAGLSIIVPRHSDSNARRPSLPNTAGRDGSGAGPASDALPPTTPTKKVPSAVIVYQNQASSSPPSIPGYRRSEELSPRSTASSAGYAGSRYGRPSMEKDLPQTPIQARAPNAREGLTDEAIPGDQPYIPLTKRQSSRIYKLPGQVASPRLAHTRTRSSRSSLRSFGIGWDSNHQSQQRSQYPYGGSYGSAYFHYSAGSDQELSRAGRASSDYPHASAAWSPPHHRANFSPPHHRQYSSASGHSRMYSSSSIPPRLSFSDDQFGSPRPLLREDIGRAIG